MILQIPIFKALVDVYVGKREKQNKLINDKYNADIKIEPCFGYTTYIEHPEKGARFILYINRKNNTLGLMHEVIHVAHNVLEYYGVVTNSDNNEMLCYLSTWLFENIKTLKKGDYLEM